MIQPGREPGFSTLFLNSIRNRQQGQALFLYNKRKTRRNPARNRMKYKIREAVSTDESRIRELYLEMLKTVYHTENAEGYRDGDLDRFWNGSEDRIYVAQENDKVLAFLSAEVHHEQKDYIYLNDFLVTEAYRNKGIGTQLIRSAEAYAREIGIPAVLLHVEKTNEKAMNLHERLGYSSYRDEGQRFLMKKDIPSDQQIAGSIMEIRKVVKESFTVIGKEGSTLDGDGFIRRLWDDANAHFEEIAHLAKRDENGNLAGIWGAMSDLSRSFLPWENFRKGLYLAGVECLAAADAPEGWTKWVIPAYEYLCVENNADDAFSRMLKHMEEENIPLAGAVHDFTCPQTGKNYMYFPIRKLQTEDR